MRASKTINRRAKLIDWLNPLAPITCPKLAHHSQADAHRHLERLPRQATDATDTRMNTYRCHICRAWHVGHMGDRVR